MIKVGDKVRITASESDLSYIPFYSRAIILNKPQGEVYHVYKDAAEVNCGIAGIWEFKISQLEVV